MTPLSDALTAAQRAALAALEKAYVAGRISDDFFRDSLRSLGLSDDVDTTFLISALGVLQEWGVSAPTMTERVARENGEPEPASDKQYSFIAKLLNERERPDDLPDKPLTKAEASEIIDAIQKGTYDSAKYRVPF